MGDVYYAYFLFLLVIVEARSRLPYEGRINSVAHQPTTKQTGFLLIGGNYVDWNSAETRTTMEFYYPDDQSKNTLLNVSMAVPRFGQSSAIMPNGTVFIVGGGISGPFAINSLEAFEPNTMRRSHLVNSMNQLRLFTGAAVVGNVLYVCGGGFQWDSSPSHRLRALNTCEMLDASGRWKMATPMNQPRCGHGFVALNNRFLYALSGKTSHGMVKTVEKFDIKTNSWTYMTGLIKTARAHAGSAVLGGEVYICGGVGDMFDMQPLSSCESIDRYYDTWYYIEKMNNYHYYCNMMSLNGALYVFGGLDTNVVEMYQVGKMYKWEKLGKGLIKPRYQFSGVVI